MSMPEWWCMLHAPFIRWDLVSNGFRACTKADIYYLETAQDEKVVCVTTIRGERNHMTYKPFDSFLEDCRAILPLSTALEWNLSYMSVGCMVRWHCISFVPTV